MATVVALDSDSENRVCRWVLEALCEGRGEGGVWDSDR